ncbi:MAG: tetratricopeptide repeat protein [Planctomycetes bacterium]|nr:tetratricopeptide repeat protein [Planctomycetota bacterium]
MSTKTLLISSVLFCFLFSVAASECYANASAQFKQADDYKKNKQYEQAEAIYQQIVTDFPDSNDALEAQKQLTLIYIVTDSQQQADAALQELLVSFSAHKDIAQAVHDIAYQYRLLKKYEKSNQIDQYVVNNWPLSDYAVLGQMDLAKYYVDRSDDPNAKAAFDKLLADFSNSPLIARAVHDVAQHYRGSGKYAKANQLYQYVIDNWPEAEHALWSQADLIKSHLSHGDETTAEGAVNRLLANFIDNPLIARAVWDTAHLYQGLKKYEMANLLYQHVTDNWPDTEHALWAQADLIKSYLALGDDPNAEAAVDKLLANFTDNPLIARTVWDTGQHYRNLKKYEMANQLYQHIVRKWPDSEHALWAQADLIKSYLALADETNAEAAVDKLLTDFNDSPLIARAIHDTAYEYRKLQRYEKADELDQYVINKWPEDEQTMWAKMDMAKSDMALGNEATMQTTIDILIADFNDHPRLPTVLHRIGDTYQEFKKYDHAVAAYRKVIEIVPNSELAADVQGAIGWTYYVRRLYDQAIIEWGKVVQNYPENKWTAHSQYWVAQSYYRKGDYEQALAGYQKVVEKYPDDKKVGACKKRIALLQRRLKTSSSAPAEGQSKAGEGSHGCGPLALVTLGHLLGVDLNATEIAALAETDEQGVTSMYGLACAARAKGLKATGMKLSFEDLSKLDKPVIAFVRGGHFIVIKEINDGGVVVTDKDTGETGMSRDDFQQNWEGYILDVEKQA